MLPQFNQTMYPLLMSWNDFIGTMQDQEGVRRGADYVLMRWPSALKQAWQKRIPRLSFCLQGVFYFSMKGKKLSLNRVWKQPRVAGGYGWLICAVLCQRNMLWRSEDNLDCPFLLFHLFDAGSLVVCYWITSYLLRELLGFLLSLTLILP